MITFENYSITKISKDDFEGICCLMTNNIERFQRYFPKTLEQNLTKTLAQEFASKKVKEFDSKHEFLFTLKENSKVIGLVYIKELDWIKKQGEFAYCIDKEQKNKGLMSKAIKHLSEHAFTELGLEVLQIIVHKDNLPSVKVAQSCNFIWQKTLSKEYTPPNEAPLDMELYELYKK